MHDFDIKQERIRDLLFEQQLDAILLHRVSSFAWATCGARSYVNVASTLGASALLITPGSRYLITSNLEAARMREEEHLEAQGWEFIVSPWYENTNEIARLTRGMKLGADHALPGAVDLSSEISSLRARLTEKEVDRLRTLCRLSAEAVETALRAALPGQTEQEMSARLAYEAELRGIQAVTNIVAADHRIGAYRHALPTQNRIQKLGMFVLNGRQAGLVSTVTRFVYFGKLPPETLKLAEQTARLAAAAIRATRPGQPLGQVFAELQANYATAGYPEEWKCHHQGGGCGYEPREFFITPQTQEEARTGQAYAWNPSIGPLRSVDVFLVAEHGNEILTSSPSWPEITIDLDGRIETRPAVLEID